jgi:hypothetical protein
MEQFEIATARQAGCECRVELFAACGGLLATPSVQESAASCALSKLRRFASNRKS